MNDVLMFPRRRVSESAPFIRPFQISNHEPSIFHPTAVGFSCVSETPKTSLDEVFRLPSYVGITRPGGRARARDDGSNGGDGAWTRTWAWTRAWAWAIDERDDDDDDDEEE